MKARYPRLIIAGLKGGSGKTVLSLGLIAAWKKKGMKIVPYKKGPDYIDSGWLSSAAKNPCYNLDQFLISKEKLLSSFKRHFGKADCAVIEGNRGLYDGMDAAGTYSTAELSKILKAPVILIVDCTKTTRTISAMVLGMQRFDRKVDIEGIILNQIAGARHEKIVRDAIEKYCRIPVLGAIPKLKHDFLSERHMGLMPFQEHPAVEKVISFCADIAMKYLDLKRLWKIAETAGPITGMMHDARYTVQAMRKNVSSCIKIGVIRDSAFQFYYPENFEELERKGAELIEVSALEGTRLPDVDALYIGGGFPETNAVALANNTTFKRSLREAIENGLPVYAECGGLMYLGESLVFNNRTYSMAGILPIKFSLERVPQAHGYTVVKTDTMNTFYKKGTVLKGHEFHYSKVIDVGRRDGMFFSFRMQRGQGITNKIDGVCYKNVLATYTHVHALGTPEWVEGMVKAASEYKKNRS